MKDEVGDGRGGDEADPPSPEQPLENGTESDWRSLEDHGEALSGDADELLVVNVDGFEGPLDLLLALARTQKVDITKISIVELAEQYLAFISEAKRFKLELAADYLVMAAWLAFLKSKLLLSGDDEEEDGPSAEELAAHLAFRLKRLEAMRDAASTMFNRKRLGRDVFARGMPEGIRLIKTPKFKAETFELLTAYAQQRQRTTVTRHKVEERKVWAIKDARDRLEQILGMSLEWFPIDRFLEEYMAIAELQKTVLASTFGATLEMARDGEIELKQARPFAPLYLRRRKEEKDEG